MNGDKVMALLERAAARNRAALNRLAGGKPQREVPQMCMNCGAWVFRDGWQGHDCDAPDHTND